MSIEPTLYKSKPYYIRRMRVEPIPDSVKKKMVSCFKNGGLKEFEADVKLRMVGVSISQIYLTDTGESERWVYVGDFWWCRKLNFELVGGKKVVKVSEKDVVVGKRKKRVRYEFARLMAFENKKPVQSIVGLWDSRIHELKNEPRIVFDVAGNKGVVTAWNEFEVVVDWDIDGKKVTSMVKKFDDLRFKFAEDFKEFRKIFRLIEGKSGWKVGEASEKELTDHALKTLKWDWNK